MGLTRTSISPLPMAYSTTAIRIPVNGWGMISGKECHQDKSQCGQNLRSGNADAITDAVSKFRGGKIHQKPSQIEDKRNQRDFFEGDSVGAFEGQKQKRRKVCGNRLGDESEIAGDLRFL